MGGGALALSSCVLPRQPGIKQRIAEIESGLGGRIGACLLDAASGASYGYREHERFAMCSTFKVALAGAILSRVQAGTLSPDDALQITPESLVAHSPVTGQRNEMTLDELCAAAVEYSDNTAANLLLDQIGGPGGMTEFFRQLGDKVSRLDRYETTLNSNAPGDLRDTTTAAAMSSVLANLLVRGGALGQGARSKLFGWMANERNARNRIRAAVPPEWTAGNKPGTSNNGAVNDIAVLWPPGQGALIISVYTNAPGAEISAGIKALADVAGVLISNLPDQTRHRRRI